MMDIPVICEAVLSLSRAYICPDEHIFDLAMGPACPVCLSEHVFPLAAWLGTTTNGGAA